jgi:S-adenosylmethionine:tRNA ribosyltransferase-isomerase
MSADKPHQSSAKGEVARADLEQPFQLRDFRYELPAELIAQVPLPGRSDSRLMVVHASAHDLPAAAPAAAPAARSQAVPADASSAIGHTHVFIQHRTVRDLPKLLAPGDHLVFNDTRVIPARLYGTKASGGRIELMLERVIADGRILASIRASKSPKPDSVIILRGQGNAGTALLRARVCGRHDDLFEIEAVDPDTRSLADFIEHYGEIPLPPYIDRAPEASDEERYQTVFARQPGAVAAPTAGLHFDDSLLAELSAVGVTHSFVTLHVGAGTFQPVREDNPTEHVMHAERVTVGNDTVDAINEARSRGGRVIAVGTTCVRALEAAAADTGELGAFDGETRLFLVPGVKFRVIDGMFTNFHLPESTLLMLVASFAGLATTLEAYRQAVQARYRFFSYGDAMLVWPRLGVRG